MCQCPLVHGNHFRISFPMTPEIPSTYPSTRLTYPRIEGAQLADSCVHTMRKQWRFAGSGIGRLTCLRNMGVDLRRLASWVHGHQVMSGWGLPGGQNRVGERAFSSPGGFCYSFDLRCEIASDNLVGDEWLRWSFSYSNLYRWTGFGKLFGISRVELWIWGVRIGDGEVGSVLMVSSGLFHVLCVDSIAIRL